MNIKRLTICTIILWIVGNLYMFLTCAGLFKWIYEIPPIIWKDPTVMMSPAYLILGQLFGLLSAFLFVLVFAVIYKGIPGEKYIKGIIYGILIWLVGALSGIISMPIYMDIAIGVVIYWIINALIYNIITGAIIGAVYKEK